MGNVNMEARQIHYRGGDKPMSVEEAIKNAGGGSLPIASAETLGGIKVGNNLSINSETGELSGAAPYVLPAASDETLGGVKIGSGLSITDGVLSATGGGGSALNYSTVEQDTGVTWVDGKTVYQKTVPFDSSVGTESTVDLTACNIDRLIDVHFHLGTQQGLQIAGGIGYFNGGTDYINGYYNNAEKLFHFRYGAYWMSATNYMTILYTKATV